MKISNINEQNSGEYSCTISTFGLPVSVSVFKANDCLKNFKRVDELYHFSDYNLAENTRKVSIFKVEDKLMKLINVI